MKALTGKMKGLIGRFMDFADKGFWYINPR